MFKFLDKLVITRYEIGPYEIFILQNSRGDLITIKVDEYYGHEK